MIYTSVFTQWLEQFINFERNPKKDLLNLEKMRFLSNEFGNPHLAYKSIHVAGSKGKGSVSTLISYALTEAGFKTGTYTSPHVSDFRERVSLSGKFFTDAEYSKAYLEIMQGFERIIQQHPEIAPTWFEIVTMLSFVLFRNCGVDYAVFEVGLGGRLDSTNIINPVASVIMPIELEHCVYLGDTVEKIAFEKAGIIKDNTPCFCFEQKKEALAVFEQVASEKNAPFFYLPHFLKNAVAQPSTEGLKIKLEYEPTSTVGKLFSKPLSTNLKLLDEVQAKNASLAASVVKYCEPKVSEKTLEKGLSKATIPGRFELVQKKPLLVLDGAHTETSLSLSVKTFSKLTEEKAILVFACAEDKQTENFAKLFTEHFETIYLTIPGSFKKSNFEKLVTDFTGFFSKLEKKPCIISSNHYEEILEKAITESRLSKKPLLITGSFYLVGEAKKLLTKLNH